MMRIPWLTLIVLVLPGALPVCHCFAEAVLPRQNAGTARPTASSDTRSIPDDVSATIARMARAYRIRVYQTYRTYRAEHNRRRGALDELFASWEAAGRPSDQQGKLIDWLAAATRASTPGRGSGPLPELPRFDTKRHGDTPEPTTAEAAVPAPERLLPERPPGGRVFEEPPRGPAPAKPQAAISARPQAAIGARPQAAMGAKPQAAMGAKPQAAMDVPLVTRIMPALPLLPEPMPRPEPALPTPSRSTAEPAPALPALPVPEAKPVPTLLVVRPPEPTPPKSKLAPKPTTVPTTVPKPKLVLPATLPSEPIPTPKPVPKPAAPKPAPKPPPATRPALVNLSELAARIAGNNMALRSLEAELDAAETWTARQLAPLVAKLKPLVLREHDLQMYLKLVAPHDRPLLDKLESSRDFIAELAAEIADARTHAAGEEFRGNEVQRRGELNFLDRLSRKLAELESKR